MYLSFDIGGTNMRLAVSKDGETIDQIKIVPTPQDFETGIQNIKQLADELSGGEKIIAVAGGVAGPIDKEKTMLVKSPHIDGWINKPLKKELENLFKAPVFLENDVALGGLGEAVLGAGKGFRIVAYLAIGTGVGSVRIVDGRIDRNTQGFEAGHQIILPDGEDCNCGGKGHLETLIGGYYLERKYHKAASKIADPEIWNHVAYNLSLGLHNTIVHWSPEVIILGGSVTKSIPMDKVIGYVSDLLKIFPTAPKILTSSLGESGLYGGLELIKQNKA